MRNQNIIEKSAMTLNDLATGGLMNPEQASQFIKMIIDQPTILKDARTVQMASDKRKLEKIGFGQRILRPGVEATALTDGQKTKPTTSTIELNAKEVIAEINISYDTLENNIEGDNLKNTLMQMIAGSASLDLEELALNGDTSSSDPYLALLNGIRKQAKSHIVDYAGKAIDKELFKKLYKSVPAKYLRNPVDWKYYTSHGNEVEWKDVVANRQTGLGDQSLQGGKPSAYGVPVNGIAMLQPYEATIDTESKSVSDVILTHPKNIVVGLSRNMRLEVDKDITKRIFIIVLTAKMDVVFEEEDAVAKGIKVLEQ